MPLPSNSVRLINRAFERVGLDGSTCQALKGQLLDALFPPRCGGCLRLGKEVFCYLCQLNLHPITRPCCLICGVSFDPLAKTNDVCAKCRLTPPKYDAARAHQHFEGPMRETIHRLKYKGQFDYARRLASFLQEVLDNDERLCNFKPDFFIPVPLHKSRLRTRGFNQSAVLAHELSKLNQVPVYEGLLRIRKTPPQVGLNIGERLKNVRGAFELVTENDNSHQQANPNKKPPDSMNQAVKGARILLIDDVFTTGATLSECAAVLKKAGAIEVCAVTLARQRSPQENEPANEHWVETVV